jgi:hypothetical protein
MLSGLHDNQKQWVAVVIAVMWATACRFIAVVHIPGNEGDAKEGLELWAGSVVMIKCLKINFEVKQVTAIREVRQTLIKIVAEVGEGGVT